MNKLSDQFILMVAVTACALVLSLATSVLSLTRQLEPLGVAMGAAYLIISIQSYSYYAQIALEKKKPTLRFVVLIAVKVTLLLIIFMSGARALVIGAFCGICLIVPASLTLILARKLQETKIGR